MTRINKVIEQLLEQTGLTKFGLAKELGVEPIMIDHYLKNSIQAPSFRVCKTIFDRYGIVTCPFTEEELDFEGDAS